MNMVLFAVVGVALPGFVLAWALAKMAGPADEAELKASDDEQLRAINEYVRELLEIE